MYKRAGITSARTTATLERPPGVLACNYFIDVRTFEGAGKREKLRRRRNTSRNERPALADAATCATCSDRAAVAAAVVRHKSEPRERERDADSPWR